MHKTLKVNIFAQVFTRIYTNLQSQTCHFGEEVVLHCGLIAKIRNARSILAHQICTSGASQRRLICFFGHLSDALFGPINHHQTFTFFFYIRSNSICLCFQVIISLTTIQAFDSTQDRFTFNCWWSGLWDCISHNDRLCHCRLQERSDEWEVASWGP